MTATEGDARVNGGTRPDGNRGTAGPATDGPDLPNNSGVLDNPVLASLRGAHAHLAETRGRAARYRPGVALFAALSGAPDPRAWADLAALAGPAGRALMAGDAPTPPPDWKIVIQLPGLQLTGEKVSGEEPDGERVDGERRPGGFGPRIEVLGDDDVPEMLDLVARTEPGPFLARTIEAGTYLGVRQDGALVAMAGERLRPPGWTEISAVCTDPAHRGQGLARLLIRAVIAGIRARGETPFLHCAADNTTAIRLYQALGFTVRRQVTFSVLQAPQR